MHAAPLPRRIDLRQIPFFRFTVGLILALSLSALMAGSSSSDILSDPSVLTPTIDRALTQRWTSLNKPNGNPGVRDLFEFVLDASARKWKPEIVEQALDRARAMRESDPRSKLSGNYRWSWNDAKPDDPNAVEFSMQYASLTWLLYRDQLSKKARAQLADEIRYSIEGIRQHRVPVSYTNIFLMKAANCIFIGEQLPDPALAREGYALLAQWIDYARTYGVHEYSSPTYYGVDLGSLGLLEKFSHDEMSRARSGKALRLFWTEIAANWFPSFQGIAGTHSRDYDFLSGHGLLDRFLAKAGWIAPGKKYDASEIFFDLSAWTPPPNLRTDIGELPRVVFQRWGENPWEESVHYVGHHFSLGSAGSAYGQQDKTLTVNLDLGPQAPVVSFAIDERNDPYGQEKVITGGGHMKLTHLVPFLTSVQHGSSALMLAVANPAKHPSPFAVSRISNFVFPSDATPWLEDGPLQFKQDELQRKLPSGTCLFLRVGDVAVALRYIVALDTNGKPASLVVARDGEHEHAMRFSAIHSAHPSEKEIIAGVWVRAEEGLDDKAFASFRHECTQLECSFKKTGNVIELKTDEKNAPLEIAVDVSAAKRLRVKGADSAAQSGILAINGKEFGRDILK